MDERYHEILYPEYVYHGTVSIYLDSFQQKLLDQRYWRPGKDFGEGLYTTTSLRQAKRWGDKMCDALGDGLPCVLKIAIVENELINPRYLVFPPGPSLAWANFIFEHRKVTVKGQEPCNRHPDIILGPMADADAGKIIQDAVQYKKDIHWFYDQIVRNKRKRLLDAFGLGYQITFSSEHLEQMLMLTGYYLQTERGWLYHEVGDKASRA